MLYISSSSCNKMPFVGTESFSDNEIRFGDAGLVVETKAFTETTNTTLRTNGFNVAAIIDSDKSTMFNKAVTYSGGAFRVPGEKYYFPETGTMSFYAAYPKTQAITVKNGAATLSYSHNTSNDLIAAKATSIYEQSTDVMMAFDHILSQVSIKAQGKETSVDYKIKSVKITAANGGTYAYTEEKWTPNPTTQTYTVFSDPTGKAVSTSTMTDVGSAMSFIPGNIKLNVVWECYDKGTTKVIYSKDVTTDVTLPQGEHTTLKLSLPFDSDIPVLLSGVFSINNYGRKVKFTKGNLYWNGSKFRCEKTQYAYPDTRNADHIGHFYWTKDYSSAIAPNFDYYAAHLDDNFFAIDGGAIEGFTVLSLNEFNYLSEHALAYNDGYAISINGVFCLVLKPDGYSGTVKKSYTASEWTEAEASGLVALPFAGSYSGSSGMQYSGIKGHYFTCTPNLDNEIHAWGFQFDTEMAKTSNFGRATASSVRLVSVVDTGN